MTNLNAFVLVLLLKTVQWDHGALLVYLLTPFHRSCSDLVIPISWELKNTHERNSGFEVTVSKALVSIRQARLFCFGVSFFCLVLTDNFWSPGKRGSLCNRELLCSLILNSLKTWEWSNPVQVLRDTEVRGRGFFLLISSDFTWGSEWLVCFNLFLSKVFKIHGSSRKLLLGFFLHSCF